MTENKRFKQLTQKGFTHAFIDIENLDTSYICDNKEDCKNIVKLLNELNDENVYLKQEKKEILDIINEKITELGLLWYGAEDNSKEEKEDNLQLKVLEEVKLEIIKTMEDAKDD